MMRLPVAAALLVLVTACGGGDGESDVPTVDGREVKAEVPCDVAKVGAVLPMELGNGCERLPGEIYVPGNRTCKDGRILYAEGEGEAVVVGFLGETAQGGQAAFRKLFAACGA